MTISSKIMALTMTAMLAAAPAFAQNYSSTTNTTTQNPTAGSSLNTNNTGATMNSGSSLNTNTTGASMNNGSNLNNGGMNSNTGVNTMGANRVRSGSLKGMSVSGKLTSLSGEHNGRITRSEFRKAGLSSRLFRQIDKNHNGIISQSELSAYENRNMGGVNRVKTR